MTVLNEYAAVKAPWTGNRDVLFVFECIGPEAIEVWLETETATLGVFTRVKVARQYYNLTFNGGRPTFVGGTVTLTGDIDSTVDRISVERNTPITQVCDISNFYPFNMPILEFMLDKLVMIIQEMMVKKCGAKTLPRPMQPYRFESYGVLSAAVVEAALETVGTYCQSIVTNGSDCISRPEST